MVLDADVRGPLARAWSTVSGRSLVSLPIAPATDRATWGSPDMVHGPTVHAIVDRAQQDLGHDWPVIPASLYSRYHRDGDRALY